MTTAPADICPWCEANLAYEEGGLTLSRRIGVEARGVYDGVLYWMCPFCEGCWHRFPPESALRAKAALYIGPLGIDPTKARQVGAG